MLEEPTVPDATPLQPALQEAEQLLRESLGEVCATDPARADTGEMIRLDEMLAIAGEAAKRAVSLRRRLRQEGRATRGARRRGAADRSAGPEDAAPTPVPDAPRAPGATDDDPSPTGSNGHPRGADATRSAVEGAALQEGSADHRTFRDSRGITWSVWAVFPQSGRRGAGLRGTYANGWLTFVSEAEKRRLSPVPEGWTTLDEGTLERLCAEAVLARPETRTARMPRLRTDDQSS
jgi:hypothetical protein